MILTGKARVAGIVGWPVAHSRSPRLHGFWLEKYGIDGAYVPLAVEPRDAREALAALPRLGFVGANVTVPHKEIAFSVAGTCDDAATMIGAVNTLICEEDGQLFGTNTDAQGFVSNLQKQAPSWRPDNGPAVVLGAGGSARAVIYGLANAGVRNIRIVNRTKGRADQLVADFSRYLTPRFSVFDWPNRSAAMAGAALLVNTTTLGMKGAPKLELDLAPLLPAAVVADIIYVPLETELLRQARYTGRLAVDGLGMLIEQARPGFKAWFGVDPQPSPELRAALTADLARESA
jgi:shikimate dehydrogenase